LPHLTSFFASRGRHYSYNVSKPHKSRRSCSRLSPYIAWGNLSLRQVYHVYLQQKQQVSWQKSLSSFASRLHWHCHFIQKFESEHAIEWQTLNAGYEQFPWREGERAQTLFTAWRDGQTGYPLVDAVMRALQATGYVNFRMRAMVVSFACHCLLLPYQWVAQVLARYFLDFEPGIHFPQIQMQASVTGINIVRIYNPVKQSQDQDPDGTFILTWVPELASCPKTFLHEPWLALAVPDVMYTVPIVEYTAAMAQARILFWEWRARPEVKADRQRVLDKHCVPNTKRR